MCKDPALTYLRGCGYNVVRLPTTRLAPMDVIGRDGEGVHWLGSILGLCAESSAVPKVQTGQTGSVRGKTTSAFELDAGLRILEGLLGPLGFLSAAARAAYSRAKYIQFTFDDPVVKLVEPGLIGRWLETAVPSLKNPFATRYLTDPDPDISAIIVSETLLSRELTVVALDSARQGIDIDLSGLDKSISGAMKLGRVADSVGRVRFSGDKLLAFGFRGHRIEYQDGAWAIPDHRGRDVPYAGTDPAEGIDSELLGDDQLDLTYAQEERSE